MIRRLAPVLLLAVWAPGCSLTGAEPTAAPSSLPASSSTSAADPGSAAVTVLRVADGDSLLVSVDGAEQEVRLLGINAPESDECFGDRAAAALRARLGEGPVRLGAPAGRDQFGRLLAYVYAGDTLLNLALVREGHALALQVDHPRLTDFLQAEERAFEGGVGLWAPDACGPPSPARIAVLHVEFDPPGPDEDDLNGEWVLLGNPAEHDADLTGWVLRDESSEHRYRFPPGTLLRPGEQVMVHTGCGTDAPGRLYWCRPGPVWNNRGDTALLLDPRGNVAGRLRYTG